MEDSLKLSIQGLKRVDQARTLKGWNRQSSSWAQAALTTVSTLKQFWRRERIQRETFIRISEAVDLYNWREIADTKPQRVTITDWAEAPEVTFFCDRQTELAQLEQWILDDKCKLVGLLGMGGMGKTTLAVKLVEQIHSRFEYVIWRSLQSTSQLKDLLLELINFFSSPQQRPMNRLRRLLAPRNLEIQPYALSHLEEQDTSALLTLLMSQLREHQCLIVLDDVDSLLKSSALGDSSEVRIGEWKSEAMEYQHFIKRISHERHQSCLLAISREPPKELPLLGAEIVPLMYLKGLSIPAGESIVKKSGSITAPPSQWQTLIHYYDGNPFILKIVAGVIQQFMQGNLTLYLETVEKGGFALADLTDLLKGHLERLSPSEQEVLGWLAIADHPLTLEELQTHLVSHQAQGQVINILESLQRRSLLHQDHQTFTISSVLKQHIRHASAIAKVR